MEKEYLFYVKRCCTKRNLVEYRKLITKIQKKFGISYEEAKKIIDKLEKNNSITINNNLVKINILVDPTRNKIYNLIIQYPGIFVNYIRKILNIGSKITLYHLAELLNKKKIITHAIGNLKLFSDIDVSIKDTVIGSLILRNNNKKIIQILLNKNIEMSELEIVNESGLARSTIFYALKKLIEINLLKKKQIKNITAYYINPKYKQQVFLAINTINRIELGEVF